LRHLAAVVRHVDVELRGGETDGPFVHRLPHERLHPDDLVRRRAALRGVVAHHVPTDRRVADVRPHVDRDPAVERVEELPEAASRPAKARREGVGRHALDAREHLREPAVSSGAGAA
jgi:hypothetical protein